MTSPSQFHLPHGITPGELELALIVALVLAVLAISRHARTVARLAAQAAAAAAPSPSKSSGGNKLKLLVLAAAGVGGWVLWERHEHAAVAVKGAPAPAPTPSPSPTPTVTQTVAPHITTFHFPLTGGDIVALWVIGAIVALGIISMLVRRSS